MFAFQFRGTPKAIVEGERVFLRHPEPGDHAEWTELRRASAHFLRPWEPTWPSDDFSRHAWRERMRRYVAEIEAGTGFPFFVCSRHNGALLGGITLGNVRRGVAHSGQIGYWIGHSHAGKGYMREAVKLVCEIGFSRNGLHRLEAACIPTNNRSKRLLESSGFECEGLLRSYLKINGTWQDHLLYSRINPLHES